MSRFRRFSQPCIRQLGGLFLLFALTACVQSEPAATMIGKPSSPLQLRLQPVGIMTPGKDNTFEAVIQSSASFSQVILEVVLPPTIQLISGPLSWQGALVTGEPQRIIFTIQTPPEGTHRLQATAYVPNRNGHIATEATYIVGVEKPDTATGIDRKPRPAHPTGNGRPVLEYEMR